MNLLAFYVPCVKSHYLVASQGDDGDGLLSILPPTLVSQTLLPAQQPYMALTESLNEKFSFLSRIHHHHYQILLILFSIK